MPVQDLREVACRAFSAVVDSPSPDKPLGKFPGTPETGLDSSVDSEHLSVEIG